MAKVNIRMQLNSHFFKILLPNFLLTAVSFYVLFTDFQWLFLLYAFLGFYILGIFGAAIGYHRYISHSSFQVNNFWKNAFIICGALTGQGSPIFWAGLHHHHHRFSDTKQDVHSPVNGFFNAFIGWQIFKPIETVPGVAPRWLYKNSLVKLIHRHYHKFYWGSVSVAYLIDIYFGLFFMTLGGWFLINLIEDLGNVYFHHPTKGYQNYNTPDNSKNVHWLAYITLGAGYHNNHHKWPGKYRFGEKVNEPDIAAWFIEKIKK